MIGRFDENGDLWIGVMSGVMPQWVERGPEAHHDIGGGVYTKVTEINLTTYIRSARHRNWVNNAAHPDNKASRHGRGRAQRSAALSASGMSMASLRKAVVSAASVQISVDAGSGIPQADRYGS
jgi:hypothetical protein